MAKYWACRDKCGMPMIFVGKKPIVRFQTWENDNAPMLGDRQGMPRGLFPKGIKDGECREVTLTLKLKE